MVLGVHGWRFVVVSGSGAQGQLVGARLGRWTGTELGSCGLDWSATSRVRDGMCLRRTTEARSGHHLSSQAARYGEIGGKEAGEVGRCSTSREGGREGQDIELVLAHESGSDENASACAMVGWPGVRGVRMGGDGGVKGPWSGGNKRRVHAWRLCAECEQKKIRWRRQARVT